MHIDIRILSLPKWLRSKDSTQPLLQKAQVWSLGQEDPLEEGTATHSSILAWRIPWLEEPGEQQSIASQRVVHDWSDFACMHTCTYDWFELYGRSQHNTNDPPIKNKIHTHVHTPEPIQRKRCGNLHRAIFNFCQTSELHLATFAKYQRIHQAVQETSRECIS